MRGRYADEAMAALGKAAAAGWSDEVTLSTTPTWPHSGIGPTSRLCWPNCSTALLADPFAW